MAAKVPANLKVETEGDLQILYFTLSSVTDGDTTDLGLWFKLIRGISACPSLSSAVGATAATTGIITWKISANTPDLIVRIAGGA